MPYGMIGNNNLRRIEGLRMQLSCSVAGPIDLKHALERNPLEIEVLIEEPAEMNAKRAVDAIWRATSSLRGRAPTAAETSLNAERLKGIVAVADRLIANGLDMYIGSNASTTLIVFSMWRNERVIVETVDYGLAGAASLLAKVDWD